MMNRRLGTIGSSLLLATLVGCADSAADSNPQPMTQAGTAAVTAGTPAAAAGTLATAAGTGAAAGTPAGVAGSTAGVAPVAGSAGNGGGLPAGTGAAAGTAAAGTGAAAGASAGVQAMAGMQATAGTMGSGTAAGKLPRVDTTDGPGPFDSVVKVKDTPPGGWLIYPEDIGRDGIKHPLFLFGPGGGTTPDTYEMRGMHWDRYGSYGFVIYVLPRSTGDGAAMKAGLDWLIEQNDDPASPLHQHLDTSKVAAAGHSMGSVTTFDFMPDDRVTTTIHISGGSFDGMGPDNLSKDTMFLCGPSRSADTAYPQCENDFTNSTVPTFYTNIQGSDHLTSGRLGWPSVIAWLLWHLADQEDQWKPEFLEPDGQFQTGVYQSQIKNW